MGRDSGRQLCKSCGAPIVWGRTEAGKYMPLDEKEVMYWKLDNFGRLSTDKGRTSHFATCPQANRHRKPRAEAEA